MNTFKVEKKILGFIEKNILIFAFLAITFFAFAIRFYGINLLSGDYVSFLLPWYKQIMEGGGFNGFDLTISDYPVSYIYFLTIMTYFPKANLLWAIKFFSIFFDFVIASTSILIVLKVNKNNDKKYFYSIFVYGLILLSPTIVLNSSVWGQCDSIYTAFVLISMFFIMNKKYFLTFIFMGIACSFKVQALFFLPLFFILYFRTKEFSILNFLIIPIVYFVISIPALISGNSISDVFTPFLSYGKGAAGRLFYNLNNLYRVLSELNQEWTDVFMKIGLFTTIIIIGISLFIFIYKKIEVKPVNILFLALFVIVIITNFMPAMHERYLYPGDVLSIVFFVANKDIKYIFIPCVVNFVSFLSYFNYFAYQDIFWFLQLFSAIIYFFFFFYLCLVAYKILMKQTDSQIN